MRQHSILACAIPTLLSRDVNEKKVTGVTLPGGRVSPPKSNTSQTDLSNPTQRSPVTRGRSPATVDLVTLGGCVFRVLSSILDRNKGHQTNIPQAPLPPATDEWRDFCVVHKGRWNRTVSSRIPCEYICFWTKRIEKNACYNTLL